MVCLKTPSNIYGQVSSYVTQLTHAQCPRWLIEHVAFTWVDSWPTQLMGPPSKLTQHLINSSPRQSSCISSCLHRTLESPYLSHGPQVLTSSQPEIIVFLENISSQQPPVTKISIPRYILHRYVIYWKIISIHDHQSPGHNLHMLLPIVEGWLLHLKLHSSCSISCRPHHMSSSCELLPWYSNIMLTHPSTCRPPCLN